MNKSELVDVMAAESGISKASAARALDAALDAITKALKEDQQVILTNFGTFLSRVSAERQVRNLKTGEMMTVPPKKQPKFKPGKGLKDEVAAS